MEPSRVTRFLNNLFPGVALKKSHEEMVDLRENLLPVEVENTNRDYKSGEKAFSTTDYVFVHSLEDWQKLPENARTMTPVAYAISNGIAVCGDGNSPYYLRTAHSKHSVNYVSANGVAYDCYVNDTKKGDWRGIHLNLEPIKRHGKLPLGYGKVDVDKETIEYSYWPSALVDDCVKYEKLFRAGEMRDTDLWYRGSMQKNGKFKQNRMYKYKDKYLVRVESGDKVLWHELKMIVWKVLNFKDMPGIINPNGTGKAQFIDAYPEHLLDAGMPFYPKAIDENNSFYQNSSLRGALNGINVSCLQQNGNLKYLAENGGDFTDHGFLQQISLVSVGVLKSLNNIEEQVKNKNLKLATVIKRPVESEMSL